MSAHPFGSPRPGTNIVDLRQAPISPADIGLPLDGAIRCCRICGCSDFDACVGADGTPCHWVGSDVCSACIELDAFGRGEAIPMPPEAWMELDSPRTPAKVLLVAAGLSAALIGVLVAAAWLMGAR